MLYNYDLPNSSFITDVSYDVESEELTIGFESGTEYIYYEVPAGLVAQLMFCESASNIFNDEIKDNFEFEKVDGYGDNDPEPLEED